MARLRIAALDPKTTHDGFEPASGHENVGSSWVFGVRKRDLGVPLIEIVLYFR